MVIEWLKFKVAPALREKFIQADEAVWTESLSKYPGFLGKQVWISPKAEDEIVLVIHWASYDHWGDIESHVLEELDRRFTQELGAENFDLIEAGDYQVRKFHRTGT